jgi:ATPase family protein associated with various cellular activities (AAA)/winged helix domain-containing protein
VNAPTVDWLAANQRSLMSALAPVRSALERHAGRRPADPEEPSGTSDSALAALAAAFGLSGFERDVLVLCAGVELDGGMAALCAEAHGDPQRTFATFGLALAALPDPHWSAVAPGAPLRYWELVELEGASPTRDPLRIAERVLHYLAGVDCVDERLRGLVEPARPARSQLPPSQAVEADRLAALIAHAEPGAPARAQLVGRGRAARALAAAACAYAGRRLQVLAADALPAAPGEQETLARLWDRDEALTADVLLIDCDRLEQGEDLRVARFADRLAGPVVVASPDGVPGLGIPGLHIAVRPPTASEQDELLRSTLAARGADLDGAVGRIAAQFDLDASEVESAVADAVVAGNGTCDEDLLWDACRAQARPKLEDLAQRLEPVADWHDLVLPDDRIETLRTVAAHVRGRRTVYDSWGFARRSTRGLGISALFAGPSGTGKTMAAEVLARELRLDLYRIDLSSVVSKYIGETEKNLRRVFDAAEGSGAVLLFDEADALFGKRTEVRDSHDRYANIEVSYLLQRVEAYRGLALLTTNLHNAIDSAFLRRIRFIVQFPFPDEAQRREIWHRTFPAETPIEGVDPERLARLSVAGGSIRNIGMNAAFLAADAGEPVRMCHLLSAARSELGKLGQPLSMVEVEDWA